MKGIGQILKNERESQNVTLEQIEEATKIRRKYLEAIENENFEVLPGEVYVKGFIATYLKYLGIKNRPDVVEILKPKAPPVDISEQIAAAEQVHEEQMAQRLQRREKKQSKKKEIYEEPPLTKNTKMIVLISVAAILVLFVLQGFYSAGQQNPNDDIQQNLAGDVHDETDNTVEKLPEKPPEPEYDGLEMTLEILNLDPAKTEKCWMKVTADGKAIEYNLTEGQIQTVYADAQIDLHLGNAGVVKVILNGEDLGTLGAQGKVVKQTFTLPVDTAVQ